jgi:hypothetical protein
MQLLLIKAIPQNINKNYYKKLFPFYCYGIFGYISSSIDPRDIKRPPLDTSRYDESNKLYFVKFQSQDGEIMRFEFSAENEDFY